VGVNGALRLETVSIDHSGLRRNELANFRDVAPPGSAMGRWVRSGVLWRSDAPMPGDVVPSWTREHDDVSWPPRVVVDLRDTTEAGPGTHPLAGPGVQIVSLPLTQSLAPAEQLALRQGGTDLTALYGQLLGTAPRWLPTLVATAAHADGPMLVHCAAGKDRTGVSVALLLALAGVPRAEIVADYLATRDSLPTLRPRLGFDDAQLAVMEHLLDVSIPALNAVLDRVGPDPVAFHREAGVEQGDIERWQERIRAV
jgi:protein-tyrosine phosphatase